MLVHSIQFHMKISNTWRRPLKEKWTWIHMFELRRRRLETVVLSPSLSMVFLLQRNDFMMARTMLSWSTSTVWMNFCFTWQMTLCWFVKKTEMHIVPFWSRSSPTRWRTSRRRASWRMSLSNREQLYERKFRRQTKQKEKHVPLNEVYFSSEKITSRGMGWVLCNVCWRMMNSYVLNIS